MSILMQLFLAALLVTSADPVPGNDDRQQLEVDFNAACALNEDLIVPTGHYGATRKQSFAGTAVASLRFRCDNEIRVVCEPGATFAFMGPAVIPPETTARGWNLMEIGGRTRVSGCNFNGDSKVGPTSEQTHLLQVKGPYCGGRRRADYGPCPVPTGEERPDFEDLTLRMAATQYRAGDSVRLLGEEVYGEVVHGAWFRDVYTPVAARSMWGIQRGVKYLNVEGTPGRGRCGGDIVKDSAVDYEQTGVGHGEFHSWDNCDFARGPDAQGGVTFSIGGYDTAQARHVLLRHVRIKDGGIYAVNAHQTVIEDSVVIQNRNDSVVSFSQGSTDNMILSSVLVRRTGSGPVVHAYVQAGLQPSGLSILGTTIIHHGTGPAVSFESAHTLNWVGGLVSTTAGPVCGLHATSGSRDVYNLRVEGVIATCPAGSRFYQGDNYAPRTVASPFINLGF